MSADKVALKGFVVVELLGPDGTVKDRQEFENLVTTVGDEYAARKLIAAVGPAAAAAPAPLTGMQIGSGAAAATKSGAGAALGVLLAGQAFDAGFPAVAAVAGVDTGWNATYKTTFAAGVGTGTVTEAVLTTTATLGTAALAAATVARVVFGAITKAAGDSLAITWSTRLLGA